MAILALPGYLAAEAVVTLVELRIYRRKLLGERGASGRRITAYTWTANLCSLLAGGAAVLPAARPVLIDAAGLSEHTRRISAPASGSKEILEKHLQTV